MLLNILTNMFSRVFSLTRLLIDGKEDAFSMLLEYGLKLRDWNKNKYVEIYYSNLWKIVNNFRYADLEKIISEKISKELGEEELKRQKEEYFIFSSNENIEDEDILRNCEIPLQNVLRILYSFSPCAFFAILKHHMKFDAVSLPSKYGVLQYDFSSEITYLELCSLLLMGEFIFNSPDGKWYQYTGQIWEEVETNAVALSLLNKTSSFCKNLSNELTKRITAAKKDDSQKEEMATDREFYQTFFSKKTYSKCKNSLDALCVTLRSKIDINKFNKKYEELAVSNGVVNLKTGNLRDFRSIDYFTFCTPIAYRKLETYPKTFNYFLECLTCGSKELLEFLQLWLGYSITGLVTEQTFLVLRGKGSNSKSVLFNLFHSTLGEYYTTLPRCVITEGNTSSGQATPQLEKLAICRVGGIAELKKKSTLDIENIKNVTGGDDIPSRSLFKGYNTIRSSTKLIIITNEMPRTNFQYSYARRILMFPCKAVFVKGLKEPDIKNGLFPIIFGFNEKMQTEDILESFLHFMVEGAKMFYEGYSKEHYQGISLPEDVKNYTEAYLRSINEVGRYILDITEEETKVYSLDQLWDNFKLWFMKEFNRDCFKSLCAFKGELEEIDIKCLDEDNYAIQGNPDKKGKKARFPMS